MLKYIVIIIIKYIIIYVDLWYINIDMYFVTCVSVWLLILNYLKYYVIMIRITNKNFTL